MAIPAGHGVDRIRSEDLNKRHYNWAMKKTAVFIIVSTSVVYYKNDSVI
jgi:hypothetical protein